MIYPLHIAGFVPVVLIVCLVIITLVAEILQRKRNK